MNIWDILILIVVALILALAFYLAKDRKRKGCCGCENCQGNCQMVKNSDEKRDLNAR